MVSLRRFAAVLLTLGGVLVPASGAAAQDPSPSSSFAQLTGAAGCTTQRLEEAPATGDAGIATCAGGRALSSANHVLVTPDGRNVYVAAGGGRGQGPNAISTFTRAADTGVLTQTGCLSDDGGDGRVGSDGICANGDGLRGVRDLALTPDGRFLYAAADTGNAVAWFARDPQTGALHPSGCLPGTGDEPGPCSGMHGIAGASGVAVSPDGAHLYVTSSLDDLVAVYTRDADTGALTLASCVSDTGAAGACTDGTALLGASGVVVSADGRDVYVTSARQNLRSGAVTAYRRDATTGALTPAGCLLTAAPRGGPCTTADGIRGATAAALSPDGRSLYVAGGDERALGVFPRDPQTGALTQAGCLRHADPAGDESLVEEPADEDVEDGEEDAGEQDEEEPGEEDEDAEEARRRRRARARAGQDDPCAPVNGLGSVSEVAVSPDGRAVFTAAGPFGGGAVVAFARDAATGALRQTGCAQSTRTYRSCTEARGVDGASALGVSADGRNLYLSATPGTVSVFDAAPATTTAATAARRGAFRVRVFCPAARLRPCAGRVRIASGRHARGAASGARFRLAPGANRSVRLRLSRRARRAVLRGRRARLTLVVSDATRRTRPVLRPMTVRRARTGR